MSRDGKSGTDKAPDQELCFLDQLSDPGSAAFSVVLDNRPASVMVVRSGSMVRAYRNSCPHIGAPLDWEPGRFLDHQGKHILCSVHGASFRIEDGFCIGGPCAGKSLTEVKIVLKDGVLLLTE